MRKVTMLILIALVVIAIPLGATANSEGKVSEIPRLFGLFSPKVGAWAEYDIAEKGSSGPSIMRMSIVGKEGDAYWYEVVNESSSSKNIMKMLVKGNPNDSDNIMRLIIKSGEGPAREMPRDFVVMGRKMATHMFSRRSGVPAEGADAITVETVGEKTLEVPAGKYTGVEKRMVDKDGKVLATYVANDDIMPFGIVISQTETTTMTLRAHGSDAKSMITGEVFKMDLPPGMPEGMPRGMPPGMGPGMGEKKK